MHRIVEILLGVKKGWLAGADEWSLRLLGLPAHSWMLLAALLLCAGLLWLTFRSYLREGDVPRRAKLTLAVLRSCCIVLVMLLLAQPALTLRRFRTDYSAVVVLMDDSLSMSLRDRYEPGQADALRAATGMDDQQLAAATRADMVRALLTRRDGPVGRLAQDHPLVLLAFGADSLSPGSYVRLLALTDVAPPGLDETMSAALKPVEGKGYDTQLALAIRQAVERSSAGRGPAGRVAGLIVLSDGQDTSRRSVGGAFGAEDRLVGAREYCRQRNIPLFTVAVGDSRPAPNLRVASLTIPRHVRAGNVTPAEVIVQARNYAGGPVAVKLLRQDVGARIGTGEDEWADTGISAQADFGAASLVAQPPSAVDSHGRPGSAKPATPGEAEQAAMPPELAVNLHQAVVRLSMPADQMGQFIYKAVVEPLPDELVTGDNHASARVTVSDEKVRILLVSGDAGWEFQYLRNYLLSHADRYQTSVWQQNADVQFSQESSSAGMQLARLPRTSAELVDKYDVVILRDPQFTTGGFDAELAALLERFVAQHRGGLCYIASDKYTGETLFGGFSGEGGQDPLKPVKDMLPVTVNRELLNIADRIGRENRVGWPVQLTSLGADHPIMALAGDQEQNRRTWSVLPGIYWSHPVIRLKPAAVALAVSSDPTERTEDNSPLPVVATQLFGRGPVVYVGTDATWRWRYVDQAAHYERFWSNLVEYLASYRLMKKRIVLGAPGETFAAGSRVRLSAEAYDEAFEPLAGESLPARLINTATGLTREISLLPQTGQPGRYTAGEIVLETPGEYELTAAADVPAEHVAGRIITVTLPEEEFDQPQADPGTLAFLSENPSGQARFAPAERFDELIGTIPQAKLTVIEESSRELWSLPAMLAVLLCLLFVEWIGRKKHNMT